MQTRFESLVEAFANLLTGMLVSYGLGMFVYPYYGFDVTPSQNTGIVVIFTGASLIRTYVWRRWFNHRLKHRSLSQ